MKARLLLLACLLSSLSATARIASVLQKGESRYERHDYEGCIRIVARHLTSDADWDSLSVSQGHSLLARAYIGLANQKNYPEALITAYHHLLGAKAYAPDVPTGTRVTQSLAQLFTHLYNVGIKTYNRGNYLQAETFLRTALRIQPSHSSTALSLGYVAWKLQDANLAYHYWTRTSHQTCDPIHATPDRNTYERSCLLLAQWHQKQGQIRASKNVLAAAEMVLGYIPVINETTQVSRSNPKD